MQIPMKCTRIDTITLTHKTAFYFIYLLHMSFYFRLLLFSLWFSSQIAKFAWIYLYRNMEVTIWIALNWISLMQSPFAGQKSDTWSTSYIYRTMCDPKPIWNVLNKRSFRFVYCFFFPLLSHITHKSIHFWCIFLSANTPIRLCFVVSHRRVATHLINPPRRHHCLLYFVC